jgi:hypothetical protein
VAAHPLLFALFLLTLPLPGLAVVLGLGLQRERSGAGPAIAAVLALLVSCALTSVVALAAALAGLFSLHAVCGANLLAALAVALPLRRGLPGAFAELAAGLRAACDRRAWLAVGVLAAAAVLYARPYEQFFGGWDPGVYVNTGASIARTGGIGIRDGDFAALAPEERQLFTHERRGLRMKYPGFVLRDPAAGQVQPFFTHLFPVWIALFDSGFGPRGGLYAAPFFSLVALVALAALGTLLFKPGTGLLAALLFGLSIPAIWQARFQTSEPVALLFFLGGWIAVALYVRGLRAGAPLAGVFFCCALLAKITSLLPLVLLLGASLVLAAAVPGRWPVAVTVGAAILVASPYLFLSCREYAFDVLRSVSLKRFGGSAVPGLALAGLALALVPLAGRLVRRFPGAVRSSAAALILAGSLYGYFVRPLVERTTDAANLVQLGWFTTPLLLALALAGVLLTLARPAPGGRGEAQLLFLAATMAAAALLAHHKQIAPFYLWALRRFVPEMLPALALFASAALTALAGPVRGASLRTGAALLLAAAVLGGGIVQGRHLVAYREYQGALAAIGRVAERLPQQATVVSIESWLATPLQFISGRRSLALSDPDPEKADRAAATLAAWASAGREVYLVTAGGAFFTRLLGLELVDRVALDLPLLERTSRAYPREIERFAPEVHIFRATEFRAGSGWRPAVVAPGESIFGLRGGFHDEERPGDGGRPFRWTAATATLDLPPPADPGRPWDLVLRLGGGRPPGHEQPLVEVLIDQRTVGSFRVGNRVGEHRIRVAAGSATGAGRGFLEVTVAAETFVPARVSDSRDLRTLGVMWESVAVVE